VALRRWLKRLLLWPLVLLGLLLIVWQFVPPYSTLMLWSGLTGQGMDRRWVPLERISPHLVSAVIHAEDARFCAHAGVDWAALGEVLEDEDGPSRGASTITMQTAKNLFLWQGPLAYLRKGLEIPLALVIDIVWSKRRIIEVYLNTAEWGPGIFGAEAAARHHFGKPAAALTPLEAARLAVALPNPIVRNPARPGPGLARRAGIIAGRLAGNATVANCMR
jgi:monofunctional biosynthetic peptidoglycan transglycosylase